MIACECGHRFEPADAEALEHRVVCGDATEKADVDRLMDGDVPFLMVTDPPYGVEYDPTWREGAKRIDYMPSETDTERGWGKVWQYFKGDVVYIWHSDQQRVELQSAMTAIGFELRNELIWLKTVWPMGRGHWKCRHESCVYMVRKGAKVRWNDIATDAYDDTTVINARPPGAGFGRTSDTDEKECGITSHACQKRIICAAKPISRHGDLSASVYDPFTGSGTTAVACEQLGRRCYGIEIEPKYVAAAIERLAGMGLTVERAA